jgi:hypothetical protein
MTREQEYKNNCSEITRQIIRNTMPEPKILAVEFCHDLTNASYSFAWTTASCASGLQKQYIKSLGLTVCKRNEATAQIIIGERPECSPYVGVWKSRASKSYWLKPL